MLKEVQTGFDNGSVYDWQSIKKEIFDLSVSENLPADFFRADIYAA